MFFRKKIDIKGAADRALMEAVHATRDRMSYQRKLIASFREVDEITEAQVELQEGLFDFLHREARERQISGDLVAEMAAKELHAEKRGW